MSIAWRGALFLVSIYIFVVALELIRTGAGALKELDFFSAGEGAGPVQSFGLGWLFSIVFLSGSPAAGLSLGLLSSGVLSVGAAYSMVMGSRIGASFVVLAIGAIYDMRTGQQRGGVYVGTLALLTTGVIYLPAWGLGYLFLEWGIFDGLSPGNTQQAISVIEVAIRPVVDTVSQLLPSWAVSIGGVGLLLGAFKLFDLMLPAVDPTGGSLGRMATTIFRPSVAFLFGMILTAMTLSVSVSLTLLVPLTARGVIRRENLIPFILGANITTFVDTILASLLVGHADAFGVVLCAVVAVTVISLPVVFLFYHPFERWLDTATTRVVKTRKRLACFLFSLFAVPLALILVEFVAR